MKLFALIVTVALFIPVVAPATGLSPQKRHHYRVKHRKIHHKTH